MSKSIWLIATLSLLLPAPCLADDPLQGRVQDRNLLKRVSRPAMPSKPLGEALEHVSNSVGNKHKKRSGFDLAASSVSNTLDKGVFDLNNKGSAGDKFKGGTDSRDSTDKELVVAWEHWHKQLCSTIYRYWLVYGNIPGEASIALRVARNGDIDFEMNDYHVNPSEQFSMNQRELFEHAVDRTLQMLERSETIEFPDKSQRQQVNLKTKFTFTETDDGPQGYSWKTGDYERVSPR